jgi:hypothetical protein
MSTTSASPNARGSSRIALDLNLGTAHLKDIIEGPAGYGADQILIRYQAPCAIEDQDVEGDNPEYYAAADQNMDDSVATVKSSSTTGSSIQAQRRHARFRQRRRRQLRRQLDDQIWYVVASIERYATQLKHLSLRFVGCSFPAEALAWLLERVERIESLHIRVTFHGSLGGLAKALQKHPNLKQVYFDHCRPSFDDFPYSSTSTTTTKNNATICRNSRDLERIREKQEQGETESLDENEYKGLDKSSDGSNKKQLPTKKAAPPKLASLEPLLDGLAQSKTLRCLTLSYTTIAFTAQSTPSALGLEEGPARLVAWNAGVSLAQFVRMTCLEKLSLEHMTEVQDSDFAIMAAALHTHHTLRTLSIRQCAIGALTGRALKEALSHNRGLQTLDVNIHWWDGFSYEETSEGQYIAKCYETDVVALIQGLQANRGVKCLGLYCDNLGHTHNAAVASILGESVEAKTNQLCAAALKELPKIFQVPAGADAHYPVQRNCVLEDVIVGHRSFGLTPETEFYLNWNRAGRNYFCREDNATAFDWMDAILNHREDLSVVYALVAMNPVMFFR